MARRPTKLKKCRDVAGAAMQRSNYRGFVMAKRGGWKHSPETKAKIAQTQRARWDDTARAAISKVTKARMAHPAVRQRIRDGSAIVRAVLNIAAALGMSATAEGVETEEQRAMLDELGCGLMQGYLFGRPTSSVDIALLLSHTRSTVLAANHPSSTKANEMARKVVERA